MSEYYLAIDIGASSGRHMLGTIEDGKMKLEEIYRFPNGMEEVMEVFAGMLMHYFMRSKKVLKNVKN